MILFPKIKKLIPQSLFARFLIIFITPIILTQLASTYIFYERHWSKVVSYMNNSLAGEIALFLQINKNKLTSVDETIEEIAVNYLSLAIKFYPGRTINIKKPPSYDDDLRKFNKSLRKVIKYPFILSYLDKGNIVKVEIALSEGIFEIKASRKRLDSPTTDIFMIWMFSFTFITFLLGFLFLKNQVRSITRLAKSLELFGRGVKQKFKPEGAAEIKKAGFALLRTMERVEKQIIHRTEMIASISHDLRTPLTRMRLNLSLLDKNHEIQDVLEDINELELMISSYLTNARGEGIEEANLLNLTEIIKNIAKNYTSIDIKITGHDIVYLSKPIALSRIFTNLLDNASRYAKNVRIEIKKSENKIKVKITDDGPGINPDYLSKIFKPFFRGEGAKSSSKNIGLGLCITKDLIRSLGGDISITNKAEGNGLIIIITLAI